MTGAVALFVLLNTIVAVLVVYLTCLFDTKNIVGFGDRDELLVRTLISAELCQLGSWTATWTAGEIRRHTGSCLGEISCLRYGKLS